MATVGDPELAAYVEMHKCCVEAEEAAVLAKVDEMLSTTPHSHTHDASPAEDAQKIADDALGLLFNFEEIGAELALTNDGQFKKEWDDAYQEFRKGLEEAVKLAEMGKKYLLDFNEKVVSRFSEGNVDWEKDKDLVADFVKENGGEELVRQSRMVEDKFKEIKYAIEWFESMYGEKTEEKGVAYNAKVKQIDQERRNIQSQIESNRSASAQLQGAMGRTAGPGCLLVRIVRAVITLLFGRRNRVFSAANNRVSQLQREEQDLLAQRAAVDRRANELVKDAAALTQTRHAMSVLVDNVGDMTGRLGTLASSWSQINQQFEYMGEMLKVATDSKSQDTFARRMSNIGKSTSFLTANMDAWTKGIAPDGVLAKPKKKPSSYDISNSYGGSDGVAFNDARPELDSAISIASIKVVRSAGIDGLHVTYRLKNGTLETKQHGQDRSNNFDEINLKETEYINMVSGIHIPTGIHQLRMQITDSATGTRRSVGPYGTGAGLAGGASFTWTGRLLCFAGVANNSVPSLGLRGIKFVQMKS
ncbi:hypothetical protein RHS04_00146 [Rhizoctonia solani]|uniref:Jacalin-type lectin domain-containing protein n=2 Tax=Rhizoctonia solani TaxID=456999 RepID=A0A8H7HH59_9AGAM|nr:hypothetical protein RHS04_00146 [Rhizoctonia solani]